MACLSECASVSLERATALARPGKMIARSLIAIKLLYIPPERLSLAAARAEPFAFPF